MAYMDKLIMANASQEMLLVSLLGMHQRSLC